MEPLDVAVPEGEVAAGAMTGVHLAELVGLVAGPERSGTAQNLKEQDRLRGAVYVSLAERRPVVAADHADVEGLLNRNDRWLPTPLSSRDKVPPIVLDWLPKADNWGNSAKRFVFSLLQPLVAPQKPILKNPRPTRNSALELAFEFQRLLDERVVNNRAELAERYGVSRARVTQVLNLLRLPAAVLSFLADSGGAVWNERQLRDVLHLSSEDDQMAAVMAMMKPVQADSQPV